MLRDRSAFNQVTDGEWDQAWADAGHALARLAAPVPELTERERGVLRHALTGGRDVTPYRNHFAADGGHADWDTLRALVARGLMTERKSAVTPDRLFHCTEAGAKAVGLHLPNDSRDAAPVPAREWIPTDEQIMRAMDFALDAGVPQAVDYGFIKRLLIAANATEPPFVGSISN